MGHNGCDGSQASGPWAIGSGYRFSGSLTCGLAAAVAEGAQPRELANQCSKAGSDPCCHLGVTWGVYLCAGKPPLADIILSHPPDLT